MQFVISYKGFSNKVKFLLQQDLLINHNMILINKIPITKTKNTYYISQKKYFDTKDRKIKKAYYH